jgi:hypothetical protein
MHLHERYTNILYDPPALHSKERLQTREQQGRSTTRIAYKTDQQGQQKMSYQKTAVGDNVHMPAYSTANREIIQIFQERARVKFPGPVPARGHPWMLVLSAEVPVPKKCSRKFEVDDNVLMRSGRKGVITQMFLDGRDRVNCKGPEPAWWVYVRNLRHSFSRIWNKVPGDKSAPYKDPLTLHARRESFDELDKKTQSRHLLPPPVDEKKPPASPSVWNKTPAPEQILYSELKEDVSRFEAFQQLDTKTQYSLFSPHQVDTGKLPSVPIGWGKLEEKAVESTIRHIRDPAIAKKCLGV